MFLSYLTGPQNKTSKYLKTTKTSSMPHTHTQNNSQIVEYNKKIQAYK